MKLSTKLAALAVATVVGGTAITGFAVAGTPSADGTITACVKSDGTPRIIDKEAGATCAAGDQVAWSSGWRMRGTYDRTQTYRAGDVVTRSSDCGYSQARRLLGTETWVKVAPGAETATADRPCPSGTTWAQISRMPDVLRTPRFPETFRIPATADNTFLSPVDGTGFTLAAWNYGDIVWIDLRPASVYDTDKCAATGTAVTAQRQPYIVTRLAENYSGWIALGVISSSGAVSRVPVDVTITCPDQR